MKCWSHLHRKKKQLLSIFSLQTKDNVHFHIVSNVMPPQMRWCFQWIWIFNHRRHHINLISYRQLTAMKRGVRRTPLTVYLPQKYHKYEQIHILMCCHLHYYSEEFYSNFGISKPKVGRVSRRILWWVVYDISHWAFATLIRLWVFGYRLLRLTKM